MKKFIVSVDRPINAILPQAGFESEALSIMYFVYSSKAICTINNTATYNISTFPWKSEPISNNVYLIYHYFNSSDALGVLIFHHRTALTAKVLWKGAVSKCNIRPHKQVYLRKKATSKFT